MLPVHDLVWKWWGEITGRSTDQQLLQSHRQGCRFPFSLEVRHPKRLCMCSRICCLTWRKNATKYSIDLDLVAAVQCLPVCSSSWLPPNPTLSRRWELKDAVSYRHQLQMQWHLVAGPAECCSKSGQPLEVLWQVACYSRALASGYP